MALQLYLHVSSCLDRQFLLNWLIQRGSSLSTLRSYFFSSLSLFLPSYNSIQKQLSLLLLQPFQVFVTVFLSIYFRSICLQIPYKLGTPFYSLLFPGHSRRYQIGSLPRGSGATHPASGSTRRGFMSSPPAPLSASPPCFSREAIRCQAGSPCWDSRPGRKRCAKETSGCLLPQVYHTCEARL